MSESVQSVNVIEVQGLTRRFRSKAALNKVSLRVPRGTIFGLVGENGAGKTTLVRHLMGMLKAEEGTVRLFGLDPVADPEGVLSRVGYLAEDRAMPLWMRVDELMRYTQAFYPQWDPGYAEELRGLFDLEDAAKVKHLSRGERAKLGLLLALAHRPEVLILDEPSSGLDLVVRRHILTAVIRTVAEEGRTVVFSSHLLDEVERLADYVALLHEGRLVLNTTMEDLKQTHHRLTLRFAEGQQKLPELPGVLWGEGVGREWSIVCNGRLPELKAALALLAADIVEEECPSLDEIYLAHVTSHSISKKES